MNYALITNGVVSNIIWLYDGNAQEFPGAVKLGDRPIGIGDTYTDGNFYRDGVEVLTPLEQAQAEIDAYKAALNELGVKTEETINEN